MVLNLINYNLIPAKHTCTYKVNKLSLRKWLSDLWRVATGDQLSKWQKNPSRLNWGIGGCHGGLSCATELHGVDILNSNPGKRDMACIVKYFSLFICSLLPYTKHFKEILWFGNAIMTKRCCIIWCFDYKGEKWWYFRRSFLKDRSTTSVSLGRVHVLAGHRLSKCSLRKEIDGHHVSIQFNQHANQWQTNQPVKKGGGH